MGKSVSLGKFEQQIGFVDQLIAIHGKLQTGRGRRHEQDAIHRAGVVLSVASWQAYVENILNEALDCIRADIDDPTANTPAPNWAKHSYKLRRAAIGVQIKKFQTPSVTNVRDLLKDALDFNPWPSWTWRQGRRQWNEKEFRKRTED